MPTTALRPRSVTEIVDAAFQILRAHYPQFVMCSALAYLPWLLIELLFVGSPDRLTSLAPGAFVIGGLGIWMTFALMSAVIIVCASQAYLGERVDVGAALRRALPRLPRVMLAAVGRYTLLLIGALLLLLPALYVAARFFALTPAIVLEDASVGGAFSRTSGLSNGRKWRVLNTIGLVALIYWIGAVGVTVLGTIPGNPVLQAVIAAFYTILAYPVIAITEALVYYDARIQSEGLDIELMAGELGVVATEQVTRLL